MVGPSIRSGSHDGYFTTNRSLVIDSTHRDFVFFSPYNFVGTYKKLLNQKHPYDTHEEEWVTVYLRIFVPRSDPSFP